MNKKQAYQTKLDIWLHSFDQTPGHKHLMYYCRGLYNFKESVMATLMVTTTEFDALVLASNSQKEFTLKFDVKTLQEIKDVGLSGLVDDIDTLIAKRNIFCFNVTITNVLACIIGIYYFEFIPPVCAC